MLPCIHQYFPSLYGIVSTESLINRLFPKLNRALYLDVDVIVQEDVALLWQQVITSNKLILVAQRLGKLSSAMCYHGYIIIDLPHHMVTCSMMW